jgi:hypothetical protein
MTNLGADARVYSWHPAIWFRRCGDIPVRGPVAAKG